MRGPLTALALVVTSVGLTCVVFFATLEAWERWRRPASTPGRLVFDAELGWDSDPAVEALPSDRAELDVYFIGDSFTDEKAWYRHAQALTRDAGLRFDGYSLGVSGYGVTQSLLKLRRHFDDHAPQVVVLLIFAWNDMRDDYPHPQIFYSPARRSRPHPRADGRGEVTYSLTHSGLLRSKAYVRHLLPAALKLTSWIAARDIDFFSRRALSPLLSYEDRAGWAPFYDPTRADSPYVRGAYANLERALVAVRDFTRERGAGLIVLALDNAFGVDPDVARRWIDPEAGLELDLALGRLAQIAEAHQIRFVNARPALVGAQRRLGGKVYLGSDGDIAGHLTETGERVVGELAARELLGFARQLRRGERRISRAAGPPP